MNAGKKVSVTVRNKKGGGFNAAANNPLRISENIKSPGAEAANKDTRASNSGKPPPPGNNHRKKTGNKDFGTFYGDCFVMEERICQEKS